MTKQKLFIILGGVFVGVILLAVLFRQSPQQQTPFILYPTPTPFAGQDVFPSIIPTPAVKQTEELTKEAVTFSFPKFTPPVALKTYHKGSPELSKETLTTLANQLSFTSQPEESRDGLGRVHYTWERGEDQLYAIPATGYVLYSSSPGNAGNLASREQAVRIAEAFLKQLGVYSSQVSIDPERIVYYSEARGDEEVVQTFQEATVLQLILGQRMENYPIVRQYGNYAIGSIWIDKTGKVIKLSLQYTPPTLSSMQVPISSLTEVEARVRQNEETLFLIRDTLDSDLEVGTFDTINFTGIEIVYFDDQNSTILYPFFLLRGDGRLNGQTRQVKALLPATQP